MARPPTTSSSITQPISSDEVLNDQFALGAGGSQSYKDPMATDGPYFAHLTTDPEVV